MIARIEVGNGKECDDTCRINRVSRNDLSSRTLLYSSSSSSSSFPSPFFYFFLSTFSATITHRLADRSENTTHPLDIFSRLSLIKASLSSLPETVSCETEREKLVAGTCCTDIRHVFRVRCARALVHERRGGTGGRGIAALLSRYSRICVASRHTISISR